MPTSGELLSELGALRLLFGEYAIDVESAKEARADEPVRVEPQVFDQRRAPEVRSDTGSARFSVPRPSLSPRIVAKGSGKILHAFAREHLCVPLGPRPDSVGKRMRWRAVCRLECGDVGTRSRAPTR